METKVKIAAIRERRRRTGFAHPSPDTHSSLCEGGSINNELIYKTKTKQTKCFFAKLSMTAQRKRVYIMCVVFVSKLCRLFGNWCS